MTRSWVDSRAVILTAGRGYGGEELVAFDAALRDGAIADMNLHQVTSIVPARVPVLRMRPGVQPISADGYHVPAVYSKASSMESGTILSAGVGIGVPADRRRAGVIFTLAGSGLAEDECIDRLKAMVADGMKLRQADSYNFRQAVASERVGTDGAWCAVMAALCFADPLSWRRYFRDYAEPFEDTPSG